MREIKHFGRLGPNLKAATGVFSGQLASAVRTPGAAVLTFALLLVLGFLPVPLPPSFAAAVEPANLTPKMSEAFKKYVRAVDARNHLELKRGSDLLWIDALPEAARKRAYAELGRGQVQLERRPSRESGEKTSCPGCMIHHWVGLVFIPRTKLDDVLRVLEDYDHHAEYYAPDVTRARIESRDGDQFVVFLRFRRQKVITVVLNTEHAVTYFRDSASGAHSRSSATHIAEVDNAGKANEREKTPGDDNGFLWGMETWWRMEEKDNGVYVQSESVSLTRNIPTGLGWMIGPFVTGIPKETLTFTLEATRKAVLAQSQTRKNAAHH